MNGRLENEMTIYKAVESKLVELPDYVIEWYYYLKANKQSAMTCRDYIRKVSYFLTWVKETTKKDYIYIDAIPDSLILRFFVSIQTKDKEVNDEIVTTETSDSYRQCMWSCLNNFFSYLESKGIIKENYITVAGIDRPSNHDLDRIKANRRQITKDDFKKILEVFDNVKYCFSPFNNRDKAMMLLLMTTGMRESALRNINVSDLDMDNTTLTVIDKGRKRNVYYLDQNVVVSLNNWLYDRSNLFHDTTEDALFLSKEGCRISINGIVKIVKKYSMSALGYELSPHKFRGGLASILYEQKKDIEFVRRVIGHSNISTTQRYIATNNKEREEAASMITGMIM